MAFPTPSDLLWVTGFPVQGRWLTPLLREAVRSEWPNAVYFAASNLGDEMLAREFMENAIAQAQEILVDEKEASLESVRRVLMRCYRNAVRRAYRRQSRLRLWGSSGNLDRLLNPVSSHTRQVEARLDVEKILRNTPEDIKHALLLRYGSRSSWEEIANETANTKDGIRMRCKRELDRLMSHYHHPQKREVSVRESDHRRETG